jgi:periplasmic copper chaperone A
MRPLIALTLAGMLAACGKPPELAADHAWIRLPAVSRNPGAAYLTLHGGAEKATLLAVSTPVALRAEMHESMQHGAMTEMTPLPQVDVDPRTDLTFAPGGKHVMLFDMNPALKPGGEAPLLLKFADGRSLTVQAKLVAAGDPAP